MNDGGMARLGVVDSCQGVGGATGGGYYLIVFFFFYLCFRLFSAHAISLFLFF